MPFRHPDLITCSTATSSGFQDLLPVIFHSPPISVYSLAILWRTWNWKLRVVTPKYYSLYICQLYQTLFRPILFLKLAVKKLLHVFVLDLFYIFLLSNSANAHNDSLKVRLTLYYFLVYEFTVPNYLHICINFSYFTILLQIRTYICGWLAWLLRMSKPGKPITLASLRGQKSQQQPPPAETNKPLFKVALNGCETKPAMKTTRKSDHHHSYDVGLPIQRKPGDPYNVLPVPLFVPQNGLPLLCPAGIIDYLINNGHHRLIF